MDFSFVSIQNSDLLILGVVNAAIGILGFVIVRSNPKSVTNRTFFLFSLITVVWGTFNYLSYHISSSFYTLWVMRIVIFLGVWHAFSFFQLFYVFPDSQLTRTWWYKYLLIPIALVAAAFTLSPLVFSRIQDFSATGDVSVVTLGPGMPVFGLTVAFLILGGILILIKKTVKARGLEKRPLLYISIGTILTFFLILTFNIFLPIFYENVRYIPLGSLFILPFTAFAFYAINKHGLLKIKIISTEILVFLLGIAALVEVVFSAEFTVLLARTSVFLLVLAAGILLIQSVHREVEQRERLETLTQELEIANEELKKLDQAKSEFISIASHQLRSPLTVIRGYIAMTLEGTFGPITKQAKEALEKVSFSAEQLIKLVASLLNLSRIESGKIKYELAKNNFVKLVKGIVEEFMPYAKNKKVEMSFDNQMGEKEEFLFDSDKIREVVVNLVDNAIKYSPAGKVLVKIEKRNVAGQAFARLSVKDTGIGATQEDLRKLFSKFSRSVEAQRVDPNGMGIGLYFVKRVVEDHGGRVWAESEGPGKGSTFIAEIPIKI